MTFCKTHFAFWVAINGNGQKSILYKSYSLPLVKVQILKGFKLVSLRLAGVAGFEPTDAGIKIPCLTAWRHPNDIKNKWGERWDSNPRPPGPQSGALTNWATLAIYLARLKGFEPLTHGLEGRCSILLSYRRIYDVCRVRWSG